MAEEITPIGAVVSGECQKKIAGVCKYPSKGQIGAVLCFNDRYRNQFNVCSTCSEKLFESGTWYLPGRAPANEQDINKYFVVIHQNPSVQGMLIGIIVPMYTNTFQGIPAIGIDREEVLENIRKTFLDPKNNSFVPGDELYAEDRTTLICKK